MSVFWPVAVDRSQLWITMSPMGIMRKPPAGIGPKGVSTVDDISMDLAVASTAAVLARKRPPRLRSVSDPPPRTSHQDPRGPVQYAVGEHRDPEVMVDQRLNVPFATGSRRTQLISLDASQLRQHQLNRSFVSIDWIRTLLSHGLSLSTPPVTAF